MPPLDSGITLTDRPNGAPCSVTSLYPKDCPTTAPCIIDVRGQSSNSNTVADMKVSIRDALQNKSSIFIDSRMVRAGKQPTTKMIRSIPTMVLYDKRGLDLFDQITYLDDYYLTGAEIDIFQRYASDIVDGYINDGSVLIELGCGSMRKTKSILEALAKSNKTATYYAVDLSEPSLRQSLLPLAELFPTISFVGLWGTYDDSIAWVKRSIPVATPKTYLWLGSSIGNLTRDEASTFLGSIAANAMEAGDLFFCGIDRRNSFESLSTAYNDSHGLTREFIMNGIDHVNAILSGSVDSSKANVFDRANFEYVSIYNEKDGRHEAYYKVVRSHTITMCDPKLTVDLEENELINVEYSYKYSLEEVARTVNAAHLRQVGKWTDSKNQYDMHVFQKPLVFIPRIDLLAESAVASMARPTLAQFENLWSFWDAIVSGMIPKNNHLFKPIFLRHPYIFYIGHLPSFSDVQLSQCLGKSISENQEFTTMFSRGIDPDIDDQSKCHDHSPIPDVWPNLASVLEYQHNVRTGMRSIYASNSAFSNRLSRVLFMCYEHDMMHIETFLQMLVQDPNVLPPLNVARPILAATRNLPAPAANFIQIMAGSVEIGLNDHENMDLDSSIQPTRFGWDNEYPAHTVNVSTFEIQDRPVTVGEYYEFLSLHAWDIQYVPGSWGLAVDVSAPNYSVKTVFGLISVEYAWNWPVYLSNELANAYAVSQGCRLVTENEIGLIRSQQPEVDFLENSNFSNWAPVDVRSGSDGAITDMAGNGWEHTSTVFAPFAGNVHGGLYPGYSMDFYDGKHNVILGASWATMQRLASRRTFRNWYQRGYPFVFAKFRLVR
ncbi:hypothetical protein BASA50_010628 [Batrachochytrium salamandrivorans]|uniref:Dimethylhistidine N-methyltransferase n=1 Tax=Batrachochytrium salamandrivorans TaxID=1357716 RepID=A0ABQ8EY60_9FUNG|nr:hypothetical protein BASA62_006719 [Batrachochytrium salamandrivorans]KAH6583838.1 hypothetical protein BASA60_001200 [Batrachochytrium salamandrivorans]KAH6588665.1 hypothetical protein BASA50_010628 [Batrachochytrium salamandrivorans]KAH6602691.1 hypothetical protein BASA61_000856 [Batrachochytrium salamandrivorans]KAH9269320.1 hypothetical protein BASA83_008682 [Batrachochytrium salamandrivorans]